ncbi:MAG: metallopeptidase TldD-related protein, partial [Planctomycetota bacterium]
MPLDTAQSLEIQNAMQSELRRAMKGLSLDGHPRPFFLSHLLRADESLNVWGRYGTVFHSSKVEESGLYAEVRVGSYESDQSIDGGLAADLSDRESYNWVEGPQELTPDAIRYCFWKLTQFKYEEALQEFYDKQKILVEQRIHQSCPSFSREESLVANHPVRPVSFPKKDWEEFVQESSAVFTRHKKLVDPFVRLRGINTVRIQVNSEGTRSVCQETFFEAFVQAWYLTRDGAYLSSSRPFYGRRKNQLPTLDSVEEAIENIVHDLSDLARSKPLEPYAGPALLSGLASGLIFHEAIGHRLEGERMSARSEGQTFATRIGARILPSGLDVLDDPGLESFGGHSLYGHYLVDDEGVPAQRVKLVQDGVLENFLLSRSCAPGFEHSNGHGRHERHQDPMARMANLIVETNGNGHSWETLKEMLIAEIQARELPYGIIIRGVEGGETRTDRYDFQAFKGVPNEVFTVDPASGKETRVRNVNFIGTPLAVIQRILAFGTEAEVDNSYCWAESGSVPVST